MWWSNRTWTSFTLRLGLICSIISTFPTVLRGNWLMWLHSVQYSAVQYSTVMCNTVQFSTLQYSSVHHSTVQSITVQFSSLQYSVSALQYKVQCITVQCCALQNSDVYYSTVYRHTHTWSITIYNGEHDLVCQITQKIQICFCFLREKNLPFMCL